MLLYNWNNLTEIEQKKILARPLSVGIEEVREKTKHIMQQVKLDGDNALIELTKQYDKVQLTNLKVSAAEFQAASKRIDRDVRLAIEFAKTQLETNHQAQLPRNQVIKICAGVFCERQARPIERVGLYVPGGYTPLVSTVLMLAIPAKIAACPIKILCTPPNKQGEIDPYLLFTAELCGIQTVYKIGGAQAIAAMAYGTETVPKVDKIFGPGNIWVTQAKLLSAQTPGGASIDMPAGPSEVMVIADDNAKQEYVIADLLAQAEHGIDSQAILVTLSKKFATSIAHAIKQQLAELPQNSIVKHSLAHGRIIIVDSIEQAISVANVYAPEHLILQIAKPKKYVSAIKNAGTIFLGKWAAGALGDYVTGSNHVLPTDGYARNFSGLSVIDFMKFISVQSVTREGLENVGQFAETLADLEGLQAHKTSVSLRLAEKEVTDE